MKIKNHEPRLKPESFPELKETADLIGEFIQYWGFKKVHGRIWAYLFLSETPLNTRQLVQLLKVSNALVCNSVAELQEYGVIFEAGKGRNGVLLYRANPNVGEVISGVLKGREKVLMERIQECFTRMAKVGKLKTGLPIRIERDRLTLLGEWLVLAQTFLDLGIGFIGTENDPFTRPDKALKLLTR